VARASKRANSKKSGGRNAASRRLPPVCVVEVTGVSEDGDILARQVGGNDDGKPPRIVISDKKRPGQPGRSGRKGRGAGAPTGGPALGPGDRALVRLTQQRGGYRAEIMRRLDDGPTTMLGVYDGKGRIRPTGKSDRHELLVDPADDGGAAAGELVVAEIANRRRAGPLEAHIVETLGLEPGSRAYSQIAIHSHGLPSVFSNAALAEADAAIAVPVNQRADLRQIPLVTIDGADARDFDDAVWAEPVRHETGQGWNLIIAIADVAAYVTPGSALDGDAALRGNSVYFTDRVVPMLPEALSNGWCSLKPDEDRACLAVHIRIDAAGAMLSHRFERGVMCSAARLTYAQVQEWRDGDAQLPDAIAAAVHNLYGAFEALRLAADKRQTLNLDMPEQKIELDADGEVTSIGTAPKYDSHQLIETFMIAANVAAAEALEKARQPFLYRVHDEPPADKLDAFRDFIASLGLKLAKGQVLRTGEFNRLIAEAKTVEDGHMVEVAVLRSQAQAVYTPTNIGHFGLGLRRYCHFTSPIRRYSDLLVHRALIAGLGLAGDESGDGNRGIDWHEIGGNLSDSERRAAAAERDVKDRFASRWHAKHPDGRLRGRISGVTRHGLFVTIDGTLADGFVPMRYLPEDYYRLDEPARRLVGRRRKLVFRIGDNVALEIRDCEPLRGSLVLEIVR